MIVHKLLLGAGSELLLPFARSRLRALAAMHGKSRFFSEKYWFPQFAYQTSDMSVEVRQAPPFQFITIRPTVIAAAAIAPAGTDVWYDVGSLAVIPWQAYTAATFLDTDNSTGGAGSGGEFDIDDDFDYEGDITDLLAFDPGNRSAWWQITAGANGTLAADILQSTAASLANTTLEIVTTDVAPPLSLGGFGGDNCDFADCYVVASSYGTSAITGVSLTSGKTYWIRASVTDNAAATYRLRITVTI